MGKYLFEREKRIEYSCITTEKTCAKLDFYLVLSDKRVIIEVDEQQHTSSSYSIPCELARMTSIMAAMTCGDNLMPTLLIRFNPHAYSVDGERQKTPKKQRLQHLLEVISSHTLTQLFEVKYLYYDTSNGWPAIVFDPDYSMAFRNYLAL